MAVTYTASLASTFSNGLLKSKTGNVTASTAGPTSLEVISIVHRLPTTPDWAWAQLRSVIATPSGGGVSCVHQESNASISTFVMLSNDGGAVRANFDFYTAVIHSFEA